MHIIPVIDVRHGIAVRAVAGDRTNYRPLQTPLVTAKAAYSPRGSDEMLSPETVAGGYRDLYPFDTIYVADLDGIEGRGRNPLLPQSLARALPDVEFWIDAGLRQPQSGSGETAVIGSETIEQHDLASIPRTAVLSLDFRGSAFLGPSDLLSRKELWPDRIVVMTLANVGRDAGPDLARIAEIAALAPQSRVYAAGGIRDIEDLRAARGAGAHGALIASALHAQKIKADDLEEIIGL